MELAPKIFRRLWFGRSSRRSLSTSAADLRSAHTLGVADSAGRRPAIWRSRVRRLLIFALAAVLTVGAARADRLDGIRSAGTLRVAAFDSNPPFGFVDPATKTIAGLDRDYARAIADGIGVKLDVHPTNPANRIPLLVSG